MACFLFYFIFVKRARPCYSFFFFLVIGVNVIGYWDLFYVFCGGWVLVGSWLGWACFCYDCDYILILILCFYIYIFND